MEFQRNGPWIDKMFKGWCEYDADCPKTQIVVRTTSAMNPLTKKMAYTITFRVICYCTTEITPGKKRRG